MRRLRLLLIAAVLSSCGPLGTRALYAQGAPTRTPEKMTAEQEAILRSGVELHDKGQYDEAIAKYQQVLASNPAVAEALFELSYSYYSKRDYDKSFDTARKGAEFKSDLLPMFYDMMASSLDSRGEPQQAIDMYRKGIALVPDASLLYYNMAVTYRESLNRPDEARAALEKAAIIEPQHPGVQLLLGQVFQGSGYNTPALLALSTFLVLDPGGRQGVTGYGLWRAVLKGAVDPIPDMTQPDPSMRMPTRAAASPPAPKPPTDEGDFSMLDALITSSYRTFLDKTDSGTPEIQALVTQIDTLFSSLPLKPDGPTSGSFVNTHYIPFFVQLKQRNYVEPFVYWASQRAPVPGVREWLTANRPRVREFLDWASKYDWSTP
jgi:Tfp pilus assembly protein PilF